MSDETVVSAAPRMDRAEALGNSEQSDGRRALHVQSFPFGAPNPPTQYDATTCLQVDANTVAYEFRTGGKTGQIIQTVTIVYPIPTTIPFVSVEYS